MSALPEVRTIHPMRYFVRHYLEMVVAMAAGMMLYAVLFRRGMTWTGYLDQTLMAVFMTVPMVGWMRYRGHTWRQAAEMSAAMLLPFAAVVLLFVEALGLTGRQLGMASHLAMLLGMLAWMRYRRDEYAHHGVCLPGAYPEGAPVPAPSGSLPRA